MRDIKKVTLTEIKEHVLSYGGSYHKCNYTVNNRDVWKVNGDIYYKDELKQNYLMGTFH